MLLSYGRGEEFYEFCGHRGEWMFQFWRKCNTQTTRSNNPAIKVTLFWPRYESETVIGKGHYAWAMVAWMCLNITLYKHCRL